jgi:hypothetical protein
LTEATTAVVADTHIVIWYVLNPGRLSVDATEALEGCVAAGEPIRVSALRRQAVLDTMPLIELVYAVERAMNPFSEDDR